MKRLLLGLLLGFLVLSLSSCPKEPGPNPKTGDFSLELNAVTIAQGGRGEVAIKVKRVDGLKDLVSLEILQLPTGVTATFNPEDAGDSSILKLDVADTVPVKVYRVIIKGTVDQINHNATLLLTVKQKADNGSFSITASPVILEKEKINPEIIGTSSAVANKAESIITIRRKNGFSQAVSLAVENIPTGVKASFNPKETNGDSSKLELELTGESVAPGKHIITVIGTSGTKTAKTTFQLEINEIDKSFSLSASPVDIRKNCHTPSNISGQFVPAPTGESTITIDRKNGFVGVVELTAENLPNGVISKFDPSSTDGNTSKLKLELAGNVAADSYTITVKGVSGTKTATTTFELTINEKEDIIKPRIISSYPANDDTGVKEDAEIIIKFSEPMDTNSIRRAFRSPDIGEVEYFWSNHDKDLKIIPKDKLLYSNDNHKKYYNFDILQTAKDKAGNTLQAALTVKFSTLRVFYKELRAEKDLDGFVASSGAVITGLDKLMVGDGVDDSFIRAFVSFDLSELHEGAVKIRSAALFLDQVKKGFGQPFAELGGKVVLGHLHYGANLELNDLSRPLLDAVTKSVSTTMYDQDHWRGKTITDWVQDDFANRNNRLSKSQFRLNFPVATDDDNSADYVMFYASDSNDLRNRPHLDITYYAP